MTGLLLILSTLAATLPALFYSLLIWWLDRYEKEPGWLLAITFLWGAMPAVLASLVAELLLGLPLSTLLGQSAGQLVGGSTIAPFVEEIMKGIALLLILLLFPHEFDGLLDGIIYGALVGFGFAMTENTLYFWQGYVEGGAIGWGTTVFMRTLIFGLNHAFYTAITGAGLGYLSMGGKKAGRWLRALSALGAAILFHALHNTFIALGSVTCWSLFVGLLVDWGGVLVVLAVLTLAWRKERGWIVEGLEEERTLETLSPQELAILPSSWQRNRAQWRALTSQGWREAMRVRQVQQLATELAFQKHRLRHLGDEGAKVEMKRLRERIKTLREG